jgi:hypothetical protein
MLTTLPGGGEVTGPPGLPTRVRRAAAGRGSSSGAWYRPTPSRMSLRKRSHTTYEITSIEGVQLHIVSADFPPTTTIVLSPKESRRQARRAHPSSRCFLETTFLSRSTSAFFLYPNRGVLLIRTITWNLMPFMAVGTAYHAKRRFRIRMCTCQSTTSALRRMLCWLLLIIRLVIAKVWTST